MNDLFNIITHSNDRNYLRYLFITACYENRDDVVKHFFEHCKILKDLNLNACNYRCITECLDAYDRTSPILKMMIYNKKKMFDPPSTEDHLYTAFMLACYTDASDTLKLLVDYYSEHHSELLDSDIIPYKDNILFKIAMVSNSHKCCKIIHSKMTDEFKSKNYEFDIFMKSFVVKANKTIEYYLDNIYTSTDSSDLEILLNACRNKNEYVFTRFNHLCSKENIGICFVRAFTISDNYEIISYLCRCVELFGFETVNNKLIVSTSPQPLLMIYNKIHEYPIQTILSTILCEYITSKVNYHTSHVDIKLLIDCMIKMIQEQNNNKSNENKEEQKENNKPIFQILCLILGSVFIGRHSYIEHFPNSIRIDSNISKFISSIVLEYDFLPEYYRANCFVETYISVYGTNKEVNQFLSYVNITKNNNNNQKIFKHLLSSNLICQYLVSKKHYTYLENIVSKKEIEYCKKHVNAVKEVFEKYELYDHLLYETLGY